MPPTADIDQYTIESTVVIKNFSFTDDGIYLCNGQNSNGSSSSSISLKSIGIITICIIIIHLCYTVLKLASMSV